MIDYSDLETVVEKCLAEMQTASREKYDSDRADKTAALCLVAQMKLSSIIEDVEMKARNSKNEITRMEGEKYFEFKTGSFEKKLTENALTSAVAKDDKVVKCKMDSSKYEAELKKYVFILNTLKEAHIFFRNIGKNKEWSA
jgi:hypothetical protein